MAYSITGATGFVGASLVSRLQADGKQVRTLHRRPPQRVLPNQTPIMGDLLHRVAVDRFVGEGDTVIHLAFDGSDLPSNLTVAANLAGTCRSRAARLIHVSTAGVYGDATADDVDESTPPRPSSAYQKTKKAIEEILRNGRAGRSDLFILRPTAIFGPRGKQLAKFASELMYGPAVVNRLHLSLMGRRRMNVVAVENVVEAIIHVSALSPIPDPIFIISDDEVEANNYEDVAAVLCSILPCRGIPLPARPHLSAVLPLLLRARGAWPANPRQRFSTAKLRSTGYQPRVSFETAVRAFAEWFLANVS